MAGTESTENTDLLLRVVMALCGCAMGILYGINGWRGSTKDLNLKDSPRVKNLLWVLGAGAGVFIADFKAIDKNADRGILLLIYALGFFVAAFLTICFWGVAIAIKFFNLRQSHPQSIPPQPFSPVFDYFWYGYAFHQARYEEKLVSNRKDKFNHYRIYVQNYVEQISLAIAAADSPSINQNASKVVRDILRSIQAVVAAYHENEAEHDINVNYMHAIAAKEFQQTDWSKVRFYVEKERSRYEYFLALREYASDEEREDFILPVERKGTAEAGQTLPGAPEAFIKVRYVVINDTSKIDYPSELPKAIANDMKAYLKTKTFKSFGSVPVIGNGRPVGVVNIDSKSVKVFGNSDQEQQEVATLLSPFCVLLGKIVSS